MVPEGLKITVIGGGSTYTPELVNGFIKSGNELPISEFCLMDIDARKLNILGGITRRMFAEAGINCTVTCTENREIALRNSDYVVSQIRVGQMDARIKDEKIPLEYDLIGQETTGIGGFMKAVRTIPVMLKIAREMEKYCPEAWLINFSNPSGLIAETLLNNTNIKCIGLCNVPLGMLKKAYKIMQGEPDNYKVDYIGLNHLAWITSVHYKNRNILGDFIEKTCIKMGKYYDKIDILLKNIKAVPCGYLYYYYYRDYYLKKLKAQDKTRGEVCLEIENELLHLYNQPNIKQKPELLDKRGGGGYAEALISLLSSIYNNKNEIHIVNVKNQGALDFMGYDDVVEVACYVSRNSITPIPMNGFKNEHIKDMMRTVKAYEKHAVNAGLYGDYSEALKALFIHPLVGDYEKAKAALDALLKAHREYLPQFNI